MYLDKKGNLWIICKICQHHYMAIFEEIIALAFTMYIKDEMCILHSFTWLGLKWRFDSDKIDKNDSNFFAYEYSSKHILVIPKIILHFFKCTAIQLQLLLTFKAPQKLAFLTGLGNEKNWATLHIYFSTFVGMYENCNYLYI